MCRKRFRSTVAPWSSATTSRRSTRSATAPTSSPTSSRSTWTASGPSRWGPSRSSSGSSPCSRSTGRSPTTAAPGGSGRAWRARDSACSASSTAGVVAPPGGRATRTPSPSPSPSSSGLGPQNDSTSSSMSVSKTWSGIGTGSCFFWIRTSEWAPQPWSNVTTRPSSLASPLAQTPNVSAQGAGDAHQEAAAVAAVRRRLGDRRLRPAVAVRPPLGGEVAALGREGAHPAEAEVLGDLADLRPWRRRRAGRRRRSTSGRAAGRRRRRAAGRRATCRRAGAARGRAPTRAPRSPCRRGPGRSRRW